MDSNADPRRVDYPIPANDDSLRAIQLLTSAFADGIISARGGKAFEADEIEVDKEVKPEAAPAAKAEPQKKKPATKTAAEKPAVADVKDSPAKATEAKKVKQEAVKSGAKKSA